MKGYSRTGTTQEGSASNKVLLLLMGAVCVLLGKSLFFPAIEGQTGPQLVAKYGEPVSKTGIPRPR